MRSRKSTENRTHKHIGTANTPTTTTKTQRTTHGEHCYSHRALRDAVNVCTENGTTKQQKNRYSDQPTQNSAFDICRHTMRLTNSLIPQQRNNATESQTKKKANEVQTRKRE